MSTLLLSYKKGTSTANQFHYMNLQRNSPVKYKNIDYALPNQTEVLSYYEMTIGRGLHVSLYRLQSSYTSIKNTII